MSTNDTKISDFTNVLKQFYALIKDTLLSGYITEDELSQKGYLTGDSEAVREKAKQTELNTHTNNSTIHVTAAERTKWNGAAANKHTHTNKAVLDATTASYTTGEKEKLKGIEEGAKANVQSDWNVADPTSDAYVKNKPTIPTKTSQLMNDSYFAYNSVVGVSTEYGATNIGYSYYDVDSKSSGGEVGLPNLRQALQEASETIAENMAKIDESIPEAPSTMTGATAAADGTSGLVPAPLKGDQNKFLRADGTWVAPHRTRYTVGNSTAADSVLITDNGIITLRVYKISNDQLMAVNQYVYVSDTYGDSNTFVGKLTANTGALSNTYGTIAVNAAGKAVKVATVKGYRIEITVMDCV